MDVHAHSMDVHAHHRLPKILGAVKFVLATESSFGEVVGIDEAGILVRDRQHIICKYIDTPGPQTPCCAAGFGDGCSSQHICSLEQSQAAIKESPKTNGSQV